jgi:hypothetical protein
MHTELAAFPTFVTKAFGPFPRNRFPSDRAHSLTAAAAALDNLSLLCLGTSNFNTFGGFEGAMKLWIL